MSSVDKPQPVRSIPTAEEAAAAMHQRASEDPGSYILMLMEKVRELEGKIACMEATISAQSTMMDALRQRVMPR